MKLSKPEDNRPLWKFKFSIIQHGIKTTPTLGLRKRYFRDSQSHFRSNFIEKARRSRKNPFKCIIGQRGDTDRKLLAAMHCEKTSGRRVVQLSLIYGNKSS